MGRKLSILLAISFGVFMVCGTAMASPYPLQFDADAGGAVYDPQVIWGWDLEAVAKEAVPVADDVNIFGTGTGQLVDFVTHQNLEGGTLSSGDTFTESITVDVLNGLSAPPTYNPVGGGGYYNGFPGVVPDSNLFIDLSLSGFITDYNDGGTPTTATAPQSILDDTFTSIFSAGEAVMYVDANDNQTFDVGETVVASFELVSAGPFILTPSVFSGAGAQISFGFGTTLVNEDYFANAPGFPYFLDSVAGGFHLTLAQGGVAFLGGQIGGLIGPDPDQILLGWQETGFDAKFEVVPEPSTMLLMGSGLLGVALLGRKKFFKRG